MPHGYQAFIRRWMTGWKIGLAILCISGISPHALAQPQPESLSASIDSLVEQDFELLISPKESDGLLLRRLSLDLRMVVPAQPELEEFLADLSVDRWPRWVRRFLDDPLHRERMVDWLDKTLMQRRPYSHVDRTKWLEFLRKTVDENKSLDSLIREIVASTWWNSSERAQQRFFLDRGGDSHAVARDIGRILYGRDMQCAQCHDHPQVDDYLQIDYHGLLAFVAPSGLSEAKFKDEKGEEKKLQIYSEKAAGDIPFESVFDKGIFFRTGPRVPGATELFEPYLAPDQRYQPQPPSDSFQLAPNPPVSSRRSVLVHQLSDANRAFAENWANRVWGLMLGRGLVHPLDMHHADNPPSNPALLNALTKSIVESGYNVRSMIEQIAISQAYQRGSRLPIEAYVRNSNVLNLTNEQDLQLAQAVTVRSQAIETALTTLTSQAEVAKAKMDEVARIWRAVQKDRVAICLELDKTEAAFQDVKKKCDDANAVLGKATKQRDDTNARIALLNEAAVKLEQAKGLSPGEDAELLQAIATAKAKSDASVATMPSNEKAVSDAMLALNVQSTALEAERTKNQEVVQRILPIEHSLATSDQRFVAARQDWRSAQSLHASAIEKLGRMNRLQNWIDQSRSVQRSEADHSVAKKSLEHQWAAFASMSPMIQEKQMILATANAAMSKKQSEQTAALQGLAKLNSELTLLQNTQSSLEQSDSLVEPEAFVAAKQTIIKSMESRQIAISTARAIAGTLESEIASQSTFAATLMQEFQALESQQSITKQSLQQAEQGVQEMQNLIQKGIEACGHNFQKMMEDRQKGLQMSAMRSLSPEQLGLSILNSTQVFKNYVDVELAAFEKQSPLAADAAPELHGARRLQATRQAIDKLRPNLDVFANLYASGAGQTSDEFFATPDQALFMANGGAVFQWSANSGNNITSQVVMSTDASAAITNLYRAVMSRDPSPQELQWAVEQLAKADDKKLAISQELVWGLLTSSEYRVYP